MLYKKIDLTQAILSNIEQEAATAFIDMRLSIKKPLTQRSFNQNMNRAVQCEQMGLCSATEAVDMAADRCWQGITPEYIQATKSREMAAITSVAVSTKTTSISHDLNDRSWMN